MADVGEIRARLVLSNDEFKRKMNETREEMNRAGLSAKQMQKDFSTIQKGSAIMGAAIVGAIGSSVKVAADFESSMAKVAAVSGASGEELERLQTAAREAGKETIFSASEAGNALELLALSGFSVEQQIDALPTVLNAAVAGNIDLASSADIVSNIMTGFGLEADQAGKAVDVLTKSFTTANTDLPMLGEALKYVAPVASSLGWTIEETSAAVGKLSDAGIQGSQAGTVLRASLLALANPTGQTAKVMEELGIEVLNSEGNMKPMPELIGHIAKSMDGMTDAQKTQAAAQLVGTQAAAGFITLLEVGEKGLAEYTKELENSGGTAQRIADIQKNTLNGAFKEFQSVLEEAGIKLGNEFLPMFTDIVRTASDVVASFDEVNAEQLKTALLFGGTATAIAGTSATIGKLVLAIKPLMAAMGPAGWLIIGASLLGGALVALNSHIKDSEKVSLDLATSFIETADSLEKSTETFDKLTEKSGITTTELGELIDTVKEMQNTTDEVRLEELNEKLDDLSEKTGLSKDELLELVDANNDIIEQSPNVEQSFSDQGNAVVESTDAVKDYIDTLRDLAIVELEGERIKNLERETELREQLAHEQKVLNGYMDEMSHYVEYHKLSQDEIWDRQEEINDLYYNGNLSQSEKAELMREHGVLQDVLSGKVADEIEKLQAKIDEQKKAVDLTQEELDKIDALNKEMVDLHLKAIGINKEGEEGVKILDKRIKKLQEEKTKLENNTSESEKQTDEYRKQVDELDKEISKHQDVKSQIDNIIGAEETSNQKKKQGTDQVGKTNEQIAMGIRKAEEQNRELGKDVTKDVDVDDKGKAQAIHDKASEPAKKEVSIWERVTRFFTGETKHGGGIVGDGKSTGVTMPKLHTGGIASDLMQPRFHNEIDVRLLQNEMVLTEGQQANLFRMFEMNQPPQNHNTDQSHDVSKLVNAIEDLSNRPIIVKVNEREIIEATVDGMSRELDKKNTGKARSKGVVRL